MDVFFCPTRNPKEPECPFVSSEMLRVRRKESEKYFDMFEGGAKLFPNDPVDDMALKIRQSMEVDREVLEAGFERHWFPKVWDNPNEITKFLGRHGYLVRDKQLEFSDKDRRTIVEKWNSNPTLSADRVKCRFVAEPA